MPAFFEYLRNITYYLMFATVVGVFAPAGKYRKFVGLVLGLVLVLMMIQPLAVVFRGVPVTQWFAGSLPSVYANEEFAHVSWWDDYLQRAFEEQLEYQLERLLADNGFELVSVMFNYSDDFSQITSVRVSVSRAVAERVPFIRIVPPGVGPIQIGEASDESCPHSRAVKTLISNFYNLPTSHIYVNII
jgi:stage III sporulation protein AF